MVVPMVRLFHVVGHHLGLGVLGSGRSRGLGTHLAPIYLVSSRAFSLICGSVLPLMDSGNLQSGWWGNREEGFCWYNCKLKKDTEKEIPH